MPANQDRSSQFLQQILGENDIQTLTSRLSPKPEQPYQRLPRSHKLTEDAVAARWDYLAASADTQQNLLDPLTQEQMERYGKNIENFIGTVKIPVGLAGPLRVNGIFAQGDYVLPLATTEAALVASYNRGAQLITKAGGCTAMLLNQGVSRAPGFAFCNMEQAGQFVIWALSQQDSFRRIAESTTAHGKLVDMRITIEGNHVYLNFEYFTGDASGQNMVTIATDAVCTYIIEQTPIKPEYHFVEANLSGDKKASAQSFMSVRGKKVSAEVTIPLELVSRMLHTTAEHMVNYWRMSAIGGVLSGTLGIQGHYANGLAALYIACGQDAACVAESAVGVTRLEVTADGGLYAAVSLPNLMVGTVGGGTGLPSQRACLDILGLAGTGKAQALAEVCAGMALAGELSIIGALSAGHFTRAHQNLARQPGKN